MRRCSALIVALCLLAVLPAFASEIYIDDLEESFPFDGDRVIEPEDDLSFAELDAASFNIPQKGTGISGSYQLPEGEAQQTTVYFKDSGKPGPTIYIVAGTHGDERAGWYTAHMLVSCGIERGKLYVLPQANLYGCQRVERLTKRGDDLNRAYPGKVHGDETQRLAAAVMADILSATPDLVLDLHEAAVYRRGSDFLGNKVIFTALDGIEILFFDLLSATEEGRLGMRPFDFISPGTLGSLNRALTQTAGIPVITVETFRGYLLSSRVRDQVNIALFCLRHLGILADSYLAPQEFVRTD